MGATIRGILKDSGFSGTDNVGFSRETFDIEIGGYSKAEEQGKGYCAFFNTVMMLAFHDYLNRRSVHAPGWLLIDTPLLGFDEGAYTANGSLRSGLFEHLKLQAANQQIIILENTDHIGELDFSGNVNVITFTKDQTDGRYGYLDGECIAGLELPKQDNAHAPHPVSAAIIYAGVFTMTCALYSSILSACWGFLLIILPGYAIVPFIALLLTRKINASWNLLWLAGTTALTYAMTLVSMAALLMLIPPKATLWFSIVKILTNSFADILSFQLFMGGYTIPTIFYILGLICRAYHNSRNR